MTQPSTLDAKQATFNPNSHNEKDAEMDQPWMTEKSKEIQHSQMAEKGISHLHSPLETNKPSLETVEEQSLDYSSGLFIEIERPDISNRDSLHSETWLDTDDEKEDGLSPRPPTRGRTAVPRLDM
jgi:hypothetical protein